MCQYQVTTEIANAFTDTKFVYSVGLQESTNLQAGFTHACIPLSTLL